MRTRDLHISYYDFEFADTRTIFDESLALHLEFVGGFDIQNPIIFGMGREPNMEDIQPLVRGPAQWRSMIAGSLETHAVSMMSGASWPDPPESMSFTLPITRVSLEPRPSGGHQPRQRAVAYGQLAALERVGPMIELACHKRLNRSLVSSETLVHVRDGVLALEAVPVGGRRQILDFLIQGDAIPASVAVTSPGFFLRALTKATVEKRSMETDAAPAGCIPASTTMDRNLWSHFMRRNLHQIMIGQLDTMSRVSSFLIILALRRFRAITANLLLPLPMSRVDIADYLAMNPDTLSRIMMRFETLRIIRRVDRRTVKVVNAQKLGQLSSIRPLLQATFCSASPSEPCEPMAARTFM